MTTAPAHRTARQAYLLNVLKGLKEDVALEADRDIRADMRAEIHNLYRCLAPGRLHPGDRAVKTLSDSEETPVDTIRRLEHDAKVMARQEAEDVLAALAIVAARCTALGGLSSLPPGLRDILPRLGEQIAQVIEQVRGIDARNAP